MNQHDYKQHDYIIEALDIISACNFADEYYIQAVIDKSRLLANINLDEIWEDQPDIH